VVGMVDKDILASPSTLDKWLADPLVQLVMRADRVDPVQFRRLLEKLQSRDGPETGAQNAVLDETAGYRSGVGIMLLNSVCRVFVGRRLRDPGHAWQMPQGGGGHRHWRGTTGCCNAGAARGDRHGQC
jgi:hypothetical protein